MATVFDGLVNLKPVDAGVTHLVNELSGITQALVNSLIRVQDGESNAEPLWARIKSIAQERLVIDFEILLAEKRDFKHELSALSPPLPDHKLSFENYAFYTGTTLEVAYNQYTAIQLISLVFWAETSGVGDIVVYDQQTMNQISLTNDVVISQGINKINIDRKLPVDLGGVKVFVGLNTNVKLKPMNMGVLNGANKCTLLVTPAIVDENDFDKITNHSYTTPVHVIAKVIGCIDDLVMERKKELAPAFKYLCAHLLLSERLNSDEFNTFTNTNQIQSEALAEEYHKQYKSQLTKALKLIYTNLEDSSVTDVNTEHQGGYFLGSYV